MSSRSGLVDSKATGVPVNSSILLTYFTASAGRSFHCLAPKVLPSQPSNSSKIGLILDCCSAEDGK